MTGKTVLASAIFVFGMANVTAASAATISVKTVSQFSQAVRQAKGGDTISVAAGVNLGSVRISSANYTSMVTITSASATNRASFRELSLSGVKNLKISKMNFMSSPEDALTVDESQNVTIDGNNFSKVYMGITLRDSVHVMVSNNVITSSFDAMRINDVEDVVVQLNTATVTPPKGVKHVDIIQVVNEGGNPTSNISILKNTLRGGNAQVHGIYFGNASAQQDPKNKSLWYSDILIQGNSVTTDAIQGICISLASEVKILDNTLSGRTTILVDTLDTDVTILRNKTPLKPHAGHVGTNWTQDKEIPNSWNVDF